MEKVNFNKETIKKFLYNDTGEGCIGTYLNINLLRTFKLVLLSSMNEKERGCINLYHLENYLIERALDSESENLIEDILNFLRSKPEYWIINSEIYLNLILKNSDNFYFDDKYENKDLSAIYNYMFKLDKYNQSAKRNSQLFDIEISTEENAYKEIFEDNNLIDFQKITNDADYQKFARLFTQDSFLEIDPCKKSIFDPSLVRHIFNFCKIKWSNSLSSLEAQKKLQNFILFFSYVEYNENLESLWKKGSETLTNSSHNYRKKYSLRLNKINEDEVEKFFISSQIKMLSLHEQLTKIKEHSKIREFMEYLKNNNVN